MEIVELGLRTHLENNGWNQIADNEYEKDDRDIILNPGRGEFKLYKQAKYLLTAMYTSMESGLTRYFIES